MNASELELSHHIELSVKFTLDSDFVMVHGLIFISFLLIYSTKSNLSFWKIWIHL